MSYPLGVQHTVNERNMKEDVQCSCGKLYITFVFLYVCMLSCKQRESIEVVKWERIMIESKFSKNNRDHGKENRMRKNCNYGL